MKNKFLSFFLFFILIASGISIFTLQKVNASYDGTYYTCDFSQYANETIYCNESANGIEWLKITGVFKPGGNAYAKVLSNSFKCYDADNSYNYDNAYFNFSGDLQIQTLNITCVQSIAAIGLSGMHLIFYSHSNYKLFSIVHSTPVPTVLTIQDNNDNVVASGTVSSIITNVFIEITNIQSNNSYHITTNGLQAGVNLSYWYESHPNFDYIGFFKQNATGVASVYTSCTFDNIKVTETTTQLWDLPSYLNYGSVTATSGITNQYFNYNTYTIATEEYVNTNPFFVQGVNIKQIAISVSSNTTLTKLNIGAYLSGTTLGYYDNVYYFNSTTNRYVLVWKDIDIVINYIPIIEFYATYVSSGAIFNVLTSNTDLKNDGTCDHRYGYSSDTLDGLYNALYNENTDLLVKVWYNLTGISGGAYGTPEIGNSSLCLPWGFGFQSLNKPYIEEKINAYDNYYLNAIDLKVRESQYTQISSTLTDYQLYINGNYKGNPTYFFDAGSGYYKLRWMNLAETIQKDIGAILEFSCAKHRTELFFWYYYWDVGYSDTLNSLCNRYQYHDNPLLFGNNQVDGGFSEGWYQNTLSLCYWYVPFTINPNANDTISLQPPTKTVYKEFETVNFGITLSDISILSYVQIWKDGAQIDTQGYAGNGKELPNGQYYASCSFNPNNDTSSGTYSAILIRNTINLSWANFTVVDRPANEYNALVYTYPNPSNMYQLFTLGWLYNPILYDNNKGAIIIQKTSIFNPFENRIVNDIYGNGTIDYSLEKDGTYYIFLCVYRNGTYYSIYPYIHTVGTQQFNQISIRDTTLELKKQTNGMLSCTQLIQYTHSYLGKSIYIKDNDQIIRYIENKPSDSFTQTYYDSGTHNIQLVLNLLGGEWVLDNKTFVILPYNENQQNNGLPLIPSDFKALIGFILVLFCAMIPFILSVVLGKNNDLEIVISFGLSVLFASLGIVLAVMLGLWDWWTLFFILMLSIITLIIVWIQNQSGN